MKALKWAASPLLAATGMLDGPKKKALPAPLPTPTRDDARAELDQRDALRRRRGGAADIVAGLGAEAGAGGKTTLGS
ncbi:MAG: hypothetical protein QOG72_2452 [Sphingomonadales bacterium]|jgi:hypothetical protein|nr:hypothetical protein [Sphingomonadales bacterium]